MTPFIQSGLRIFDLKAGRTLCSAGLAVVPDLHVADDFALRSAGNAHVTDTTAEKIFEVGVHGRKSVLAQDARFAALTSDGLKDIVWYPDGHLFAVRYDIGSLVVVPNALSQSIKGTLREFEAHDG
ncbi:hypothetical protein [Lentzea pudingi]|uniref:hypothetical protein n=1 Tax=Lentzea pudingi TaxID=1789439 RepID=UPI0016647028|nr:hypothetical protein [Lentzea pudingi]